MPNFVTDFIIRLRQINQSDCRNGGLHIAMRTASYGSLHTNRHIVGSNTIFSKHSRSKHREKTSEKDRKKTVFNKIFCRKILKKTSMNFRATLGKIRDLSGNFEKHFFGKSVKKHFSKKFRKNIGNFSENFCHSWSRNIINCSLTG